MDSTDYLVLKTYALDEWDEALDTFPDKDGSVRWDQLSTGLAQRGLLEVMYVGNSGWFQPFLRLRTYRLTPAGWDAVDFEHVSRTCPPNPSADYAARAGR